MSILNEEYESTIKISISCSDYETIKAQYPDKQTTFVIYFENYRISNLRKEIKVRKHTIYELYFFKNKFIPCKHTIASEQRIDYPVNLQKTKSIVKRTILFEEYDTDNNDNVRIAIEVQTFELKIEYYLCVEIEFINKKTFYENIHSKNLGQRMCELCYLYINQIFDNLKIKCDEFDASKFGKITSRKFADIQTFNPHSNKEYILKAKYDGVKGKFCNNLYFIDTIEQTIQTNYGIDMDCDNNTKFPNQGRITKLPEQFDKFKNVIFQIEFMESGNIIVTDIIGIYINDILYSPNPNTVLTAFSEINIQCGANIQLENCTFPLYTQKELPSGFSPTDIIDKYDGFIITWLNNEYKFKTPTCDVRMKNTKLFLDSSKVPISYDTFSNFEDDVIYEIVKKPEAFVILRRRPDRLYTSSRNEFNTFLKNSAFMNNFTKFHKTSTQFL